MIDWLTTHKIPIGEWLESLVNWLESNAAWLFDAIAISIETIVEFSVDNLLKIPAHWLILIIAGLIYAAHRRLTIPLLTILGLGLIINLGYWEETIETLVLVSYATIICLLIGLPLGILAAHHQWLDAALRPILDLTQTIPTFVYLIPTLILFGVGIVPGLISTIIFAIAAPVRLTSLGIRSVPDALIEAGKSFGCTPWQLLWKIELPHALPTIMAGVTQCIMLSLSMVVVAALVGADGLGEPVVRALNTANIKKGFEAGLAIVILAILLDRIVRRPGAKNQAR